MELPSEAEHRIGTDHIVWLTTVTDRGVPAPNPVWFVLDGDELIVFTTPGSRRVHNIQQRPTVTLHFNSDAHGGDVVVITGTAELTFHQRPSACPGYLAKYGADLPGLGLSVDDLDKTYDTRIRVRPTRVRLTAG